MSDDDDDILAPEPPDMAWLLTFADLVSLLITFFVLLYSMKTVDQSRWDEISGALKGVFAEREAIIFVHPEDFETADIIPEVPADQLGYLENLLLSEVKNHPQLKHITTEYAPKEDQLRITLPTHLLFESGSGRLTPEGKLAVIALADILRHWDNRMQVAGHTGPQLPVNEPTNWELGMMRAINVARIMYDRGLASRVPAFSYADGRLGEISPYISEEERYQLAKRVEIIVFGDKDAP